MYLAWSKGARSVSQEFCALPEPQSKSESRAPSSERSAALGISEPRRGQPREEAAPDVEKLSAAHDRLPAHASDHREVRERRHPADERVAVAGTLVSSTPYSLRPEMNPCIGSECPVEVFATLQFGSVELR
eukprot:3779519-Rhodomonas_salina.1